MPSIRLRNSNGGNGGNGGPGGGTIEVTFPPPILDILSKDAEFTPYCVEYQLNGVFQQDSTVLVGVWNIDGTVLLWQGMFINTGTTWQPYTGVPGGATEIAYIVGGCTSVNAIAEGVEIGVTAAADALAEAIADALANSTAFAEAISNAVATAIGATAEAIAEAIADALASALGKNFALTEACATLNDGTNEPLVIAQTMDEDSNLVFAGIYQYQANGTIQPYTPAIATTITQGSCAELETAQNYTNTVEFCNRIDNGNGTFSQQRYIVITVFNTVTNTVIRQAAYSLPDYSLYVPVTSGQSEILHPECCDECPKIVNVETVCVQVQDPCDAEAWNLVLDLDENTAIVNPVSGNNATATIAWTSTLGVVVVSPTSFETDLTITGTGSITATITVTTPQGSCDVILTADLVCDVTLNINTTYQSFVRRYELRSNVPFGALLNIDGITINGTFYNVAVWATLNNFTLPLTGSNINVVHAVNFFNWALQTHGILPSTAGFVFSGGSHVLYACQQTTVTVQTTYTQTNVSGSQPFIFMSFVGSNFECGDNVVCLEAVVTENSETNIAQVTGYTWLLSAGLDLVAGVLTDPGICVSGTGTWAVVVNLDNGCGNLSETGVIGNLCANNAQISVTPGGEVCAGLEVANIIIDQANHKITFELAEDDTIPPGMTINSKRIETVGGIFTGSRNNVLLHPDNPGFAAQLSVIGDTANFVLDYPQEAHGITIGTSMGIANGGGTTQISINGNWLPFAVTWNETTDPTGISFAADMQSILDGLEATANCIFEAATYVTNSRLYFIVRAYGNGTTSTGDDGVRYKENANAAIQITTGIASLAGQVAYRVLDTPCGLICYALRFKYQYFQSGKNWSEVLTTDFVIDQAQFVTVVQPYSAMPECCTVPTVLAANLQNTQGFTVNGYAWTLGSGVTLVSGQISDQSISVEGSGTVTVIISTQECDTFTNTITI